MGVGIRKVAAMQFHVELRLMHPEYLPAVTTAMIAARSHDELDAALAKLVTKWKTQGYRVRVVRVRPHGTRSKRARKRQHHAATTGRLHAQTE
jgi:hypothetical protein